MASQFDFFGEQEPPESRRVELPSGFRYQRDVITPAEETDLLARIRELPFREFEFHGYTGKRRIVSFGWHRDKNVFNEIVGISLLAPCVFRLRRSVGDGWERVNVTAEPRSAYLLSGAARSEWEHSIPPVDALRYSVTFRNLR